jgi:ankyrin repeat protein
MSRKLTSKSTVESLKREAKRWLKAVRDGDPRAVERLAQAYPKAPAPPTLRDVQHALALEYGHESWVALRAALDDLAIARRTHAERVDEVLGHAWLGDVRVARRILERHPEIATDSLFTAAITGDLAEVERRLATDPDAARATGGPKAWTALAFVTYGRLDQVNAVEIARRLLAAGADPNFRFDDGWGSPFTVLTGAIRLGEGARPSHAQAEALVDLLIATGAETCDLQTLYNISIVGADLHWYEVLWRHAEAKGETDKWRTPGEGRLGRHEAGETTLDYLLGNAVGQNHLARAEWLLARGANPNTAHFYTRQPVHALAQLSGFLEMAALLERHGARPAALSGVEAFQAACLRHDAAAARALLADQPELVRHPAPLLAAAMFGDAAAVRLLLDLGAEVGALDQDGISPLHRAVQSGSLEAVNLLLEAGADLDLRDGRWRGTALSWAVALGQPHVAERLAPLSHDVRALASLARIDRLEAVLAEAPALANHVLPEDRPTPLFCLPDDEDLAVEVARTLLRYGADPSIVGKSGETAERLARKRGLDDAADLLKGARHGR